VLCVGYIFVCFDLVFLLLVSVLLFWVQVVVGFLVGVCFWGGLGVWGGLSYKVSRWD